MSNTPYCKRRSSRREFFRTTALLGGSALLSSKVGSALALASGDRGRFLRPTARYELGDAENVIYSACLACHTACTMKGKLQDGVLVKLDGNGYSPMNMLPQIPYSSPPQQLAPLDGKLCPKGQAGVQIEYDPYRIRKVLKRVGARGEGKWKAIPFDQAIDEIVNGGRLFGSVKGEEQRGVPGFKDVFALKDPKLGRALAADARLVAESRMTVSEFKARHRAHLDLLIDPDHPDLGPLNNRFVFQGGRIEHGRNDFAKRFTHGGLGSVNWYDHFNICEESHHIATGMVTAQIKKGRWAPGPHHFKPDFQHTEFVIFWGTGAFEANFGPTPMSEQVTRGLEERNFKLAVIDPRCSKTAAKAWRWVAVKPGGDHALALAMIRWIVGHDRYDKAFLQNANKAAALKDGEKSWSSATWLVKIDGRGRPGAFLRASEIGLGGGSDRFVVMRDGRPAAVDPYDTRKPVEGELFVDREISGVRAKSAFQLLKEAAFEKTDAELAELAGVETDRIAEIAQEFTSHGKKAGIDLYRGACQHTSGYYICQAIMCLNVLVGNPDWKGGLSRGGGSWHAMGGRANQPFDLHAEHPGKLNPFGVKLTREGSRYDESTLFSGYPAKRPWFPFAKSIYSEVIPSADAGYPYGISILWLHMGTPVLSVPGGHVQARMLQDTRKFPLIIATDIVIGESSMYADYIFPDVTYLERWGIMGVPPSIGTKGTKVRQPMAAPVTEIVTVAGEPMPASMEAVMLAIADRLKLPGYGKDGFARGLDFKRPEDFYLKHLANVAAGDSPGDEVPAADDAELRTFRRARRHLPAAVFDAMKWRKAAGERNWRRVVYVLNRGGRFAAAETEYRGRYLGHTFGQLWNLYVEPVALCKDSVTGERFNGIPKYVPPSHSTGRPLSEGRQYPFSLITFKEIFGGQSRTISTYWSNIALEPENTVLMNRADLQRLSLRDGEHVRLVSEANPKGVADLGRRLIRPMVARVQGIEGIRPGVVAVSWHYGHWAYGSNDVVVDGARIKGDERRARGLCTNPVLLLDEHSKTGCLTDPIGGSASFYDTRVQLIRA